MRVHALVLPVRRSQLRLRAFWEAARVSDLVGYLGYLGFLTMWVSVSLAGLAALQGCWRRNEDLASEVTKVGRAAIGKRSMDAALQLHSFLIHNFCA